ncbi:MAG: phage tail protein [Finegoldia sp.]|nr:hypothetical protein [Bacteroidaceae bacterium]MDY6064956.1 phage tail protein [Finegoldia sp.]
MPDTKNVSASKPSIKGGIWVAPEGSKLPTSASEELDTAFKGLGFVSEDGLTNENNAKAETIKDWGGETILTVQTEKPDNFTFKLVEILNVDVLKFIYGSDNVSGTLETGITVKANASQPKINAIVIDMIMTEGVLKRIVIPRGIIGETSEVEYTNSDAVGYEVTVSALAYNDGNESNTHFEYISKPAGGLGE